MFNPIHVVSAVRAICKYDSSSQFAVPDLVISLSQDLQDQHLDDGVEFIVFFSTTLVKNLLTEILPLTTCAYFYIAEVCFFEKHGWKKKIVYVASSTDVTCCQDPRQHSLTFS